MALGLADSKANWRYAEGEARRIELDIGSGNFDATLKKYRPEVARAHCQLTASKLFRDFTEHKSIPLSSL